MSEKEEEVEVRRMLSNHAPQRLDRVRTGLLSHEKAISGKSIYHPTYHQATRIVQVEDTTGKIVRSCVHRRDAEGAERTQRIVEILNKAPLRFLRALGVSAVKSSHCARLKYR